MGKLTSGHAARKRAEAKRTTQYEQEALQHNRLHAQFFGVPNVPLREVRDRLDPILRLNAIREITKIYIGEKDEEQREPNNVR